MVSEKPKIDSAMSLNQIIIELHQYFTRAQSHGIGNSPPIPTSDVHSTNSLRCSYKSQIQRLIQLMLKAHVQLRQGGTFFQCHEMKICLPS